MLVVIFLHPPGLTRCNRHHWWSPKWCPTLYVVSWTKRNTVSSCDQKLTQWLLGPYL